MPEYDRDEILEHRWDRLDDGSEEGRIVAKCKYCDIGACDGGCVFTPEEWDALVVEGRIVLEPTSITT